MLSIHDNPNTPCDSNNGLSDSFSERIRIAHQIVSGLSHLHSLGKNLYIFNMLIKLHLFNYACSAAPISLLHLVTNVACITRICATIVATMFLVSRVIFVTPKSSIPSKMIN